MSFLEPLDEHGLLRGRVDRRHGRVRYALVGDLDSTSAPGLGHRLAALSDGSPGDLCLDLSEVDVVDPTGVRVLLAAHTRLADEGRRLVLLNAAGSPYRALETTDLLGTLHIG